LKHLLACVWLVLCAPVLANIGSVTEHTGAATIKRGKETIAVSKGTVVEQNDKVETKNGRVKIVFKDDTQVSVTEHSSLVIDDFVYDPNTKTGKLGLKAAAGTVRYVSGAIAKDPKAVNIKTPTAAIAVRGTDFVMSVNETGGSMVILMPTCDWETSAVKGLVCGSGAIDVESGPNQVKLTRPYQATLVESAGQPPTPPITVNLFNTPVGNNLQIAPPRTMTGAGLVAAARQAAASTGVTRQAKSDAKEDKNESTESQEQQVTADKKSSPTARKMAAKSASAAAASSSEAVTEEKTSTEVAEVKVETDLASKLDDAASVVAVAQSAKEPETTTAPAAAAFATTADSENYVKKLWRDRAETQQVGWQYERLSNNNRNYTSITLPINTQVNVVVTQDMQTTSYNFAGNRAQGQIVINQNFR
jgi:FecR protein